jgi:ferredoxin
MTWLALMLLLPVTGLAALWIIGERGHLLLPSTRRARFERRHGGGSRGRRSGRGGLLNSLHGYVYGRWTFAYIRIAMRWVAPRLGPRGRQAWADHYHGKVLPPELARCIIQLDHDITRTDLERIIPYPTARDIVLKSDPDIVLFECVCRHARETPCTPTRVCMVIGGGDFTLEHHPGRSHRATRDEALALLEAEHARGHVHTAYFKDACDHRFYAICNCCRCCCGGLEAMREHGIPMVAASGYVAVSDPDDCAACGECADVCPFDAISVNGHATVSFEACMGCGVCVDRCSTGAMTLRLDERKGLPLDVRHVGVQGRPRRGADQEDDARRIHGDAAGVVVPGATCPS